MTNNAVATGVSATICIILLIILIITATLLYRQWRRNQEQKRLREARARRYALENAFQPVPTISGSVTPSMTSLYDSKDDTALVPTARRKPHGYVNDNTPMMYTHEDTVQVTSEPHASVGGRRAQRVSYSKGSRAHVQNGHVTSSKIEALPVAHSSPNPNAGYGSLGTDALRYSYGSDQSHNTSFDSNFVNPVNYAPPSRDTDAYANGAIPRGTRQYPSHNTEV